MMAEKTFNEYMADELLYRIKERVPESEIDLTKLMLLMIKGDDFIVFLNYYYSMNEIRELWHDCKQKAQEKYAKEAK